MVRPTKFSVGTVLMVTLSNVAVSSRPSVRALTASPACSLVLSGMFCVVPAWVQVVPSME